MKKRLMRTMIILAVALLVIVLRTLAVSAEHQEIPWVIDNRPKLVVGDDINYPPYSFLDSNGEPTGFNVALARAVGAAMGYEVEIRLAEWSKTREALDRGEIDVISGMFYSQQREISYGFTLRHSVTHGDIFTARDIEIERIEDLQGHTVVVQRSDIFAEYLASLDMDIRLVEVPTVNDALALIHNGTYQYAGLSKLPGLYGIGEKGWDTLRAQGLQLSMQDYSMAVKRDNLELLTTLDAGLQTIKATGEYQHIYDEWLGIYEPTDFMKMVTNFRWIIIAAAATFLLLAALSLILRYMVGIKTKELYSTNLSLQENQLALRNSNTQMESAMEELISMERKLRDHLARLMESKRNLKVSEQKNRAIIQALPDNVMTLDRHGTILDCQVSSFEDKSMFEGVFIGKKLEHILPVKAAGDGYKKIRTALSTGKLQHYDYEMVTKNHREIYEMRIAPLGETKVIGISRKVTSDRMYQEKIEYLSYHDHLTGLYNRRFLEEELKRLDVPRNLPLCIVMGDVNGLKLVNDSFGHLMGDRLLVAVAQVLKEACRSDEIISRIGGDEFVILLPGVSFDSAEKLVNRIQVISAKKKVASIDLSISFGWETKNSEDDDIDDIFKRAEDYMYKKKLFEGPSMRSKTINAIISTLHEKNKREEEHSHRVSTLAVKLAQVMGFPERQVQEIKMASMLHDIGKISIDEAILNKEGALNEDEYNEVKRHPETGYRILSSVNDMHETAEYVLCHHEWWDGTGYPRGLRQEEIPVQSRIIAVADAYDSIISERSYRITRSSDEALQELIRCAGTQFDPLLVQSFVNIMIEEAGG
jgi:diguanylate cyclase (GGDEF)-like protein